MDTTIAVRITKKGLLVPRDALDELGAEELEAVRQGGTIVIRPKSAAPDERTCVRQVLRDAGLLYEPEWECPGTVSPEERARLAQGLGRGQALSELIIADREDRA